MWLMGSPAAAEAHPDFDIRKSAVELIDSIDGIACEALVHAVELTEGSDVALKGI